MPLPIFYQFAPHHVHHQTWARCDFNYYMVQKEKERRSLEILEIQKIGGELCCFLQLDVLDVPLSDKIFTLILIFRILNLSLEYSSNKYFSPNCVKWFSFMLFLSIKVNIKIMNLLPFGDTVKFSNITQGQMIQDLQQQFWWKHHKQSPTSSVHGSFTLFKIFFIFKLELNKKKIMGRQVSNCCVNHDILNRTRMILKKTLAGRYLKSVLN